jgi:hypothetical protein
MSFGPEYSHSLSQLTGDPFQEEVCVRLGRVILSFQPIPRKPQGDGGLDGLSHDGEHAYCCYGPEYDPAKKPRDLVDAIVDKFKEDLRKLFELDTNGTKFVHKENKEIATIVADGTTIKHIKLIVNWFESHRLIGPINTALKKYRKASACKYVDRAASVVIWGPKEFAGAYVVDEDSILRIRHSTLLREVKSAAETVNIADPTTFEAKIAALKTICPTHQEPTIEGMREQFLTDWRMSLAFEQKLDSSLPTLHQALEADRLRIAQQVRHLMISSQRPHAELARAEQIANDLLANDFRTFGSILLGTISSGEIARLMGDCLIAWEAPPNA